MQNKTNFEPANHDAKMFTVTVNTAVDWILTVNNFTFGQDTWVDQTECFAAGKGINAARTIASFGFPVTAFGFVGSESMELFEALNDQGLTVKLNSLSGACRSNFTLTDRQQQMQSHLRSDGYCISEKDENLLLKTISDNVKQGNVLILTGSLPNGAGRELYKKIIDFCHETGCRVYFDSSGDALESGLAAKPFLIKPNLEEFEHLMKSPLNSLDSIIDAAKDLLTDGIRQICVSRAEQGVVYVDPECTLIVTCDTDTFGPKCGYVGCGDSLLAGLVLSDVKNLPREDRIKFAVACSVANMYGNEPGALSPDLIPKITDKIKLIFY